MITLRQLIVNIRGSVVFSKSTLNIQKMRSKSSCNYEAAIEALNCLQSNAQYLRNVRNRTATHSSTILQVQKYLLRSDITLNELDKLSVIHVSGTKGKGSTSSYCESILRHHGYRTGFYSSPHLLEVRERIQINGCSLPLNKFASYFWELYNKLQEKKEDPYDMPLYFRFLTLLAFKIFLREKVDVAIIEVGIGGEYDCTNVLRKVPIVGITSLGFDHTNLLGETIEEIAWNKAGIMKKNCKAFTVPQEKNAMKVLMERSVERKCTLQIINENFIDDIKKDIYFPSDVMAMNASLSVALAEAWCATCGNMDIKDFKTSQKTKLGLKNSFWPGRFQVLYARKQTYYIDGAHTVESLQLCASWFLRNTVSSQSKKVLIFNATGDRNSINLLSILHNCKFNKVLFVPNTAKRHDTIDNININVPDNEQMVRCKKHRAIWTELNTRIIGENTDDVQVYPSVLDSLRSLNSDLKYDILVTGSLYLVGAVLSIIDPELKGDINTNYCHKNIANLNI